MHPVLYLNLILRLYSIGGYAFQFASYQVGNTEDSQIFLQLGTHYPKGQDNVLELVFYNADIVFSVLLKFSE